MANLAIDLQAEIEELNEEYGTTMRVRIGISTGRVIAGVIGRKKFAYDVWGEAVNLAARLESAAEAGEILVSEATYERLKDKYQFEQKHDAGIPGQSNLPAFVLVNRKGHPAVIRTNGNLAA
jgi:adenylate cyclase